MAYDEQSYHRQRAEQCRNQAETASDPEVRKRHQQLAQLHAGRAMPMTAMDDGAAGLTTG